VTLRVGRYRAFLYISSLTYALVFVRMLPQTNHDKSPNKPGQVRACYVQSVAEILNVLREPNARNS